MKYELPDYAEMWRIASSENVRLREAMEAYRITLRDQFAMAAMSGDWAAYSEAMREFTDDTKQEFLQLRATLYYRMASAMMEARKEAP